MSLSKLAKIVAFGDWKPQPNNLTVMNKADEIENFFITSLAAIHALKDSSKYALIETVFDGDHQAFSSALLNIARLQIKDELEADTDMADNIRRMACEIGKVDWISNDAHLCHEEVLKEIYTLIEALFPRGCADTDDLNRLADQFSKAMGDYFNQICFSPSAIFEAYEKRMINIKTKRNH